MKKLAIFLVILAIFVGGVFVYIKLQPKSVVASGDASNIKINLNIKDNKKEEEKPEPIPEEIVKPNDEELSEIDSGDEVIFEKRYTDFDLLAYMNKERNYMISPFSIKMALMMTANGAEGDTQKEILKAFGVEDIAAYNQKAEELIQRYNSEEKVSLNVANSIWLNKDIALNTTFSEEFKNLIAKYYKGEANEVTTVDAVSKVNTWVEEKTNGKIKDLINNPSFICALVNTLYFKGEWANQFDDYLTEKEMFTDYNGTQVEKDFMNKTDRFSYFEDDTMQMLKMPYNDFKTSMYIAIPKTEESLDFNNAINNMSNKKVNVTIPKFKVEFDLEFTEILKQMGIEKAFSEFAEFSKLLDTKEPVAISEVIHKTFIEVDENGTEAAAATAVLLKNMAARPQPEEIIEFIANKPFTYFIRDDESGEILFLGEILY